MRSVPKDLLDRIHSVVNMRRCILAVAGAPGSGKSLFAERLKMMLDERQPGRTGILPMDGFHFDDVLLESRGHRSRKGAPHTFDVEGFVVMLDRLRADDGREVVVPVFDRSLEIARAGARAIDPAIRVVIVEGNYLLLAETPWSGLRDRFDLTVMLDVAYPVLEARLRERWNGYGFDAQTVAAKLEGTTCRTPGWSRREVRPHNMSCGSAKRASHEGAVADPDVAGRCKGHAVRDTATGRGCNRSRGRRRDEERPSVRRRWNRSRIALMSVRGAQSPFRYSVVSA